MPKVPIFFLSRFSVWVLPVLLACGKEERRQPSASPPGSTATANPPKSPAKKARVNVYYSGSIGKFPVQMELRMRDTAVAGAYAYEGKNSALYLEGKLAEDGAVILREYADEHIRKESTGVFEGVLRGESLTGTWYGKNRAKSFPFRVARFAPDKRTVLREAIGEYPLFAIQGSMGANGMYDYFRENGKWEGGASAISQGQREGFEDALTAEHRRLLSTFKIVVGADLSVDISGDGQTLVHIPFDSAGMYYRLIREDGADPWEPDTVYKPDLTFFRDRLAIAYQDSADLTPALEPLSTDLYVNITDRMILDFIPIARRFELRFGHNSFNTGTLDFRKRAKAK